MAADRSLVTDALLTGVITAVATFALPALLRARRGEPVAASLNAESHVLWGDEAARHDEVSLEYTGVGAATHLGACLFWSTIYEAAMGDTAATTPRDDYAGAAAVAAGAYVIDYHLVPKRFTPGFEMRYSTGDMLAFFATLVATLPLRRLLARRERTVQRREAEGQRRAPTAPVFASRLPVATAAY
jgi:hypothetical protein